MTVHRERSPTPTLASSYGFPPHEQRETAILNLSQVAHKLHSNQEYIPWNS